MNIRIRRVSSVSWRRSVTFLVCVALIGSGIPGQSTVVEAKKGYTCFTEPPDLSAYFEQPPIAPALVMAGTAALVTTVFLIARHGKQNKQGAKSGNGKWKALILMGAGGGLIIGSRLVPRERELLNSCTGFEGPERLSSGAAAMAGAGVGLVIGGPMLYAARETGVPGLPARNTDALAGYGPWRALPEWASSAFPASSRGR